jgi:AcrR family transcriptional regulator
MSVGAPRRYRSKLRRQQAEATRSLVVATAARLFATDGYARTTMAKIAAEAGVSAETVQSQGPKAALLIAAIEYSAVGVADEENLLDLDVGRALLAIDDREEALDFVVGLQADVHGRTAQLAKAVNAGAHADAALGRYLKDLTASVNRQIERVLTHFGEKGWLRDDVPFDELVETAAVVGSVETYLRMTDQDGWSVDAYRSWCKRMLAETVFVRDRG